jgi:hypothetical protein
MKCPGRERTARTMFFMRLPFIVLRAVSSSPPSGSGFNSTANSFEERATGVCTLTNPWHPATTRERNTKAMFERLIFCVVVAHGVERNVDSRIFGVGYCDAGCYCRVFLAESYVSVISMRSLIQWYGTVCWQTTTTIGC